MSAFGRLWDRAPAWRLTVVAAVSTMIVAAFYAPWHGTAPNAPIAGKYQPPTAAQLLGPPRRDVVVAAGRQVPLPPGEWHTIVHVNTQNEPPLEAQILVRVSDDRVVGVVATRGNMTPSETVHKLPYGTTCSSSAALDSAVVQTGNNSRECWGIVPSTPQKDWQPHGNNALFALALDRLKEAGISLPPQMLVAEWFHADDKNWATSEYFFDPAQDKLAPQGMPNWMPMTVNGNPEASAYVKRIASWMRRWSPLLQKGIGGGLGPSDLALAKSTDDPS
jgi:hypothetical protein